MSKAFSFTKSSAMKFRVALATVALVVIAAIVPAAFALSGGGFVITSPSANATVGTNVTVAWNSTSGARQYKVQLSSTDDPNFEGADYTFKTSGTKLNKNLYTMTYIARVTALDTNGKRISRTPTVSFTVSKNGISTTTTKLPPVTAPTTVKPTTPTTATPTTVKPTVPVTTAPPVTSPPPTPGNIWIPKPGTSWYWQINGTVNENVNASMYDIDLFDAVPSARSYSVPGFGTVNVPKGSNAGVIERLHAKGKVVICYVDTGAAENNRPDISLIPKAVIGTVAEASDGTQWDEGWLDTRAEKWSQFAPVMWARFDLAKQIGCDGVEPDQNNHVGNQTGFPESVAQDVAWYLEVAKQAHARGLSVGMKNGVESVNSQTVKAFDWNLNEECNQYDECDTLSPFIAAGKAVFNAEYPKVKGGAQEAKTCANASKFGLSSMGFPLELQGGYYFDCVTKTTAPIGKG